MQQRFVDIYVNDPKHNGAKAAEAAGFSPNNPNQARFQASQLLAKPHVKAAVKEGLEEIAYKVGISQERVLLELAKTAFADLSSIVTFDECGEPVIDPVKLQNSRAPVTEIEITRGSRKSTKVKVSSQEKMQSLLAIIKMLGWSKEKVEVNGIVSLEALVRDSLKVTDESNVVEGEVLETDDV